jgi:selenocysteine-specific elongation factor
VGEPEDRVRHILHKLALQGRLHRVVPDLFYEQGRVRELAAVVRKFAREKGAVEAAAYRDAIGVGRKRAIQILEFFDRLGFTRRVRSAHVLRTGGNWFGDDDSPQPDPAAGVGD